RPLRRRCGPGQHRAQGARQASPPPRARRPRHRALTFVASTLPSDWGSPSTRTSVPFRSTWHGAPSNVVDASVMTLVPRILNASVGQLPEVADMRPSMATVVAARPACVTSTLRPATVRVPVRSVDDMLGATSRVTTREPSPDALVTTTTHGTFDTAVHVQLAADAVTVTSAWPPSATMVSRAGTTSSLQGGGAASCVTLTGRPATDRVAVRGALPSCLPAWNGTRPSPLPAVGPGSV